MTLGMLTFIIAAIIAIVGSIFYYYYKDNDFHENGFVDAFFSVLWFITLMGIFYLVVFKIDWTIKVF